MSLYNLKINCLFFLEIINMNVLSSSKRISFWFFGMILVYCFGVHWCRNCMRDHAIETALKPNEKPFPLEEFLQSTGINTTNINWKGYQCKKKVKDSECHCRNECHKSGKCCIDFLWHYFAFNNKTVDENVRDYTQFMQTSLKSQSCLPLFPFEKEIEEYYIMVDSCLPDANEIDVRRCLNSSSIKRIEQMPVLGNDNYLYKNNYCARCNSVYSSYRNFLSVDCYSKDDNYHVPQEKYNRMRTIDILKSDKNCRVIYVNNAPEVPQGGEGFLLKCNLGRCSRDDAMLCRAFTALFRMQSEYTYKNIYCRKCLFTTLPSGNVYCSDTDYFGTETTWSRLIDLNDY